MKNIFNIGFVIGFLISIVAFAGNHRGNGGSTACFEYINSAVSFKDAIKLRGAEYLQKIDSRLDYDKLLDVSSKIDCIPDQTLDRDARTKKNEKGRYLTTLNEAVWVLKNKYEKIELLTHEILVAAELESEGEYFISNKLFKGVINLPQFILFRSSEVIYLPDNYVLIREPRFYSANSILGLGIRVWAGLSSKAICLSLGYKTGRSYKYTKSYDTELVEISEDGQIEHISIGPDFYVASVTCSLE